MFSLFLHFAPMLSFLTSYVVFLLILKYYFKLPKIHPLTLLGIFIIGGILSDFGSILGFGIISIIVPYIVFLALMAVALSGKYKLNWEDTAILLLTYIIISLIFMAPSFVQNIMGASPVAKESPVKQVDLCQEFPATYVSTVINKQIVKTEPNSLKNGGCEYFISNSELLPYVIISIENKDYAQYRAKFEKNFKISTDPRIGIEHYIQYYIGEDNVFSVNLMINSGSFMDIFNPNMTPTNETITNEEMILLSSEVAKKIPSIFNLK